MLLHSAQFAEPAMFAQLWPGHLVAARHDPHFMRASSCRCVLGVCPSLATTLGFPADTELSLLADTCLSSLSPLVTAAPWKTPSVSAWQLLRPHEAVTPTRPLSLWGPVTVPGSLTWSWLAGSEAPSALTQGYCMSVLVARFPLHSLTVLHPTTVAGPGFP